MHIVVARCGHPALLLRDRIICHIQFPEIKTCARGKPASCKPRAVELNGAKREQARM